jgi:FtsZ-interacting cell division protein ZipA
MNNFLIIVIAITIISLIGIIRLFWKGKKEADRHPMPTTFEDINLNRKIDRIMYKEFRKKAEFKDYNDEDIDQSFMNGLAI